MAAREINLISEKEALSPEEIRLKGTFKFWTPLILIIFSVILGITIFFKYTSTNQLLQLDTQINTAQTQIKNLQRSESAYNLLKQKAAAILNIINSRFSYLDVINFYKSFENNDIKINNISLKNSGEIQLYVRLTDSAILDGLLTAFIEAGGKRFKTIELTSINLKPDYSYEINLNMTTMTNQTATQSSNI